jgi:hypothetical protein
MTFSLIPTEKIQTGNLLLELKCTRLEYFVLSKLTLLN